MSALAGIHSRRGAPISRSVLASMSRGLEQMGPDGERIKFSASVGMLFRPFHTDRESRQTNQPAVAPDGCMLSFDGRLDNPTEVRRDLAGSAPAGTTVDLVLAVYRRWGIEGFARLVGDFALALWDPEARRLVLCTDSLGRRPLYYRVTPEHVFWSSWCRPLREATGMPMELDDEYVASYLMNRVTDHSPFRGISLLLGGHALIVEGAREELVRYWSFDSSNEITYSTDGEYEHHFNALFEEAVACRLTSDGPVFCELSGGVDSSTIVCVADRLEKRGAMAAPGLHTVSYVFDSSPGADERTYIQVAEEQMGRRGLHMSEDQYPLLTALPASFAPDLPTNQICFLPRQDQLAREMDRLGSRVVLSGIGGDQMFWSEPPAGLPLADLLSQRRLPELARQCGEWSRVLRWPFLKTLWLGACQPLLPRRLQGWGRDFNPVGEWLDPGFTTRLGFQGRILGAVEEHGYRLPSTAMQAGFLRNTMRIFALERCLSQGYLDVRYPYLDRRLVEFALAIPLEQKVRPGETRSIVRRAFRGTMADRLRNRTTKSGPAEAVNRALIREWPRLSALLSEPRLSEYGFVDRDAFRTALMRARHGLGTNLAQLQRTISLELWLRTLDRNRDPRGPGDPPPPSRRRQTLRGDDHDARHLLPTV